VFDDVKPKGEVDIMSDLARRVPLAVLAARLGFADADRAADAVIVTAAAYFAGAGTARERIADVATAELVGMLQPAGEEVVAAKIAVMVQACEAVAGLIGRSVCLALPPYGGHSAYSADAIVSEVARYDPPLRVTRRVSQTGAQIAGSPVPPGSAVLLHVDSANWDPQVFEAPAKFDPGRSEASNLTFGYGLRPCPGQAQALALAAGVVQAVRERCAAVAGEVEYEPPGDLRIPARVKVSLQ
jgi:cytochrome P450